MIHPSLLRWPRLAALGILLAIPMRADDYSATTSDAGQVTSLNGAWLLIPDPKNEGEAAGWFNAGKFPQAQAKTAQVPGVPTETYHIEAWDNDPPTNAFWYLRTFSLAGQPAPHTHYYLRFAAVKDLADIWLNGTKVGSHGGRNGGGEDPFEFDVTKLLRPGQPNTLVVRARLGLLGGIWQPVNLVAQPDVRIIDAFAKPDAKGKKIDLQVTLENNADAPAPVDVLAELGTWKPAKALGHQSTTVTAAPGISTASLVLPVENPHLWDLNDPFLYTIKVTSTWKGGDGNVVARDIDSFRTGFRDFRMVNGYWYLNGRRIYIKSAHGNQVDPVYGMASSRDMTYLYKELDQLKKGGFNMMRCLVASAMPEQLDYADEHGMLYFTEHETSWPDHIAMEVQKDPSYFGRTLNHNVRRDRNHPCLVLWGLLNETENQAVYQKAKAWLPSLRAIDDTRCVLLSSGRWDHDFKTASLSNAGSQTWDTYMGGEDPVNPKMTDTEPPLGGGFQNGTGDAHIYTDFPLNWRTITKFIALAKDTKPFLLSEAGMGTSFDPILETEDTKKVNAPDYILAWKWLNRGVEGMKNTWSTYGLDATYPNIHDAIVDSDLSAVFQRDITFSMVRGNPQINGYSLTSIEDFWGAGEGVMNNFRDYKPGHLKAMQEGWAPLRWCLLVNPTNVYADKPLHVLVALANLDVLPAGDHAATLSIVGPGGEVWKQPVTAHVQANGPLAYRLFDQDVTIPNLAPGKYKLMAKLDGHANAAASEWPFTVTARESFPKLSGNSIIVAGVPKNVTDLLTAQSATLFNYKPDHPLSGWPQKAEKEVILVGGDFKGGAKEWRSLYRRAAQGAHIVFLNENVFTLGNDRNKWLAVPAKGGQNTDWEWLYHKDCIAKKDHPIFAGLPTRLMEPMDYGPMLANTHFFEGVTVPDNTAAIAFRSTLAAHYEYHDGVVIGAYKLGAGHFTICALDLEGTVGNPATDRLLLNLALAAQSDAAPGTAAPPDFDATMDKLAITDPPASR